MKKEKMDAFWTELYYSCFRWIDTTFKTYMHVHFASHSFNAIVRSHFLDLYEFCLNRYVSHCLFYLQMKTDVLSRFDIKTTHLRAVSSLEHNKSFPHQYIIQNSS